MKTVLHRAEERGTANHGWLNAKHSFSFGQWYDPNKIQFGALRVLNDDSVAPSAGFPTHPHDNMEIITIPLSGAVRHQDSMGNGGVIQTGELQVMSAGTGIQHSEFNASNTQELKLFQIWIFPKERNVTPRYDQFKIDTTRLSNNFLQLIGPNKEDEGSWIHQDAWIHMAEINEGNTITYNLKDSSNGIYIMIVEGNISIEGIELNRRDALGISETEKVPFFANKDSRVLVIEVPLN